MKTATLIKDLSAGYISGPKQNLYQLSEPLEGYGFVVVSTIVRTPDGIEAPETAIFGANSEGKVSNWTQLRGSFAGKADHVKALENAGYAVVPQMLQSKPETASFPGQLLSKANE